MVHQPDLPSPTEFQVLPLRFTILHGAFLTTLLGLVLCPLLLLALLLDDKRDPPALVYLALLSALADCAFLYGMKTGLPRMMLPALVMTTVDLIIETILLLLTIKGRDQRLGSDHQQPLGPIVLLLLSHAYHVLLLIIYVMAFGKVRKMQQKARQMAAVGGSVVSYHNGMVTFGEKPKEETNYGGAFPSEGFIKA